MSVFNHTDGSLYTRDVLWIFLFIATLFLLMQPCIFKFVRSRNRREIIQEDSVQHIEASQDVERAIDLSKYDDEMTILIREVLERQKAKAIIKHKEALSMSGNRPDDEQSQYEADKSFASVESFTTILEDLDKMHEQINLGKLENTAARQVNERFDVEWVSRRAEDLGIDLDVDEIMAEKKLREQSLIEAKVAHRRIKLQLSNLGKQEEDFPAREEHYEEWSFLNEVYYYFILSTTFDKHIFNLLKSKLLHPVLAGISAIGIVGIISKREGVDAVVAYGIVIYTLQLTESLMGGLPVAATLHTKHSIVQTMPFHASQYIQQAIVTMLSFIIPSYLIWCIIIEQIMIKIGASETSASLGRDLTKSLFLSGISRSISKFIAILLASDGYTPFCWSIRVISDLWRFVAVALVAVIFNGDLNAIGWSISIVDFMILFILLSNSFWTGSDFWSKFGNGLVRNWSFKNTNMTKALYITWKHFLFDDFLDFYDAALLALLSPRLGSIEAASWIILSFCGMSLRTFTETFGEVTAFRVQVLLGTKSFLLAKESADRGKVYGIAVAVVIAFLTVVFSSPIGKAFSDDDDVVQLITDHLPIFGTLFIPTMVANVCWAVLCVQQNKKFANFVVRGSMWCICIPFSLAATLKFGLGLNGFTGGVSASVLLSAFLLWHELMRTDWYDVMLHVCKRNITRRKRFGNLHFGIDDEVSASNSRNVFDEARYQDAIDDDSYASGSTVSFSNVTVSKLVENNPETRPTITKDDQDIFYNNVHTSCISQIPPPDNQSSKIDNHTNKNSLYDHNDGEEHLETSKITILHDLETPRRTGNSRRESTSKLCSSILEESAIEDHLQRQKVTTINSDLCFTMEGNSGQVPASTSESNTEVKHILATHQCAVVDDNITHSNDRLDKGESASIEVKEEAHFSQTTIDILPKVHIRTVAQDSVQSYSSKSNSGLTEQHSAENKEEANSNDKSSEDDSNLKVATINVSDRLIEMNGAIRKVERSSNSSTMNISPPPLHFDPTAPRAWWTKKDHVQHEEQLGESMSSGGLRQDHRSTNTDLKRNHLAKNESKNNLADTPFDAPNDERIEELSPEEAIAERLGNTESSRSNVSTERSFEQMKNHLVEKYENFMSEHHQYENSVHTAGKATTPSLDWIESSSPPKVIDDETTMDSAWLSHSAREGLHNIETGSSAISRWLEKNFNETNYTEDANNLSITNNTSKDWLDVKEDNLTLDPQRKTSSNKFLYLDSSIDNNLLQVEGTKASEFDTSSPEDRNSNK